MASVKLADFFGWHFLEEKSRISANLCDNQANQDLLLSKSSGQAARQTIEACRLLVARSLSHFQQNCFG
jgi:hypothetical protein